MCPIPIDEETLFTAPLPSMRSAIHPPRQPTVVEVEEEDRGRSRSRSPDRLKPICIHPPLQRVPYCGSRSGSFSHSRSSSPRWRRRFRSKSRSLSPVGCPYVINILPSPPPPVSIVQSGPSQVVSPPSWYTAPPSGVWPTQVPKQPIDILTFKYDKSMAYAPATKTYDEAIDYVLELWPELRDVERDQIKILVKGPDNLVRVPKMTWSAILCDVPRYEVMHVQVEQLPPPPEYQGKGKGKGKWGDDNDKRRRSSGLFSSIRRIFFG